MSEQAQIADADDFILSGHALESMQDHGLTEDDVYAVLGDYDEEMTYDDGRMRLGRMMEDGRWLVAIVEADGKTVVTVWQDKRQSRRYRERR